MQHALSSTHKDEAHVDAQHALVTLHPPLATAAHHSLKLLSLFLQASYCGNHG